MFSIYVNSNKLLEEFLSLSNAINRAITYIYIGYKNLTIVSEETGEIIFIFEDGKLEYAADGICYI